MSVQQQKALSETDEDLWDEIWIKIGIPRLIQLHGSIYWTSTVLDKLLSHPDETQPCDIRHAVCVALDCYHTSSV
jgi:hypothetical protein